MWSQGPPPPQHGPPPIQTPASGPPPPAAAAPPPGGWQRPPPAHQGQGGDYQYQHQHQHHDEGRYAEDDDDEDGALSATINLVTSAASMFFKTVAAPPPPPPPQQHQAPPAQPVRTNKGPPPPIDPTTSMLDDMEPSPTNYAPPPPVQTTNPYSRSARVTPSARAAPPRVLTTIGSYDSSTTTNVNSVRPLSQPPTPNTEKAMMVPPLSFPSSPLANSSPRVTLTNSPLANITASPRFAIPSLEVAVAPPHNNNMPPTATTGNDFGGAALTVPPVYHSQKPPTPTTSAANVFGGAAAPAGPPVYHSQKPPTPINRAANAFALPRAPAQASTANAFGAPVASSAFGSAPTNPAANSTATANVMFTPTTEPPPQPPTPTDSDAANVFCAPTNANLASSQPPTPVSSLDAANVFGASEPSPAIKLPPQPPTPTGPDAANVSSASINKPPTPTKSDAANVFGSSTNNKKPPSQPPTPKLALSTPPTSHQQRPSPRNSPRAEAGPAPLPILTTLSSSAQSKLPMRRPTPPPSPKAPPSPATPLRTNQSTTFSSSSSAMPGTDRPKRTLPTPSKRQLRAPPKAQISPRSTPRPKFRLPPPRKNKVAPLPPKKAEKQGSGSKTQLQAKGKSRPTSSQPLTPKEEESREGPPTTPKEATIPSNKTEDSGPPIIPSIKDVELPVGPSSLVQSKPPVESKAAPVEESDATEAPEETVPIVGNTVQEIASENMPADNRLPAEWTESMDQFSGRMYYYNTTTQETSWERPTNPVKEETLVPGKVQQEQDVFPSGSADEDEGEPRSEGSVGGEYHLESSKALPVGWVETSDPISGRIYYFNQSTQETVWERPKVEAPPSTLELIKEQAIDSTFSALNAEFGVDDSSQTKETPHAVLSASESDETESYSAVHIETIPAVAVSASVSDSLPEETQTRTVAKETNRSTNPIISDSNPIPSDWSEVADPSSGNTYYYNSKTQVTSWEKPITILETEGASPSTESMEDTTGPPEDAPFETEVASESKVAAASANHVDSAQLNPSKLPEGWSEVVDPSSGQTYFFNCITQETAWDHPGETEKADEDLSKNYLEEGTESEEADANTTLEEISKDLQDHPGEMENSDDNFSKNQLTEETEFEEADANTTLEEIAKDLSPEIAKPEVVPQPEATPSVSQEWTEIVDPSSGATYYYNTATQETSWERPTVIDQPVVSEKEEWVEQTSIRPADSTDSASEVLVDVVDSENVVLPTEDTQETTGPLGGEGVDDDCLPADWVESVDQSSGNTYYYNTGTQETSWEKPAKAVSGAEEAAPEPISHENDLLPALEPQPSDAPNDFEGEAQSTAFETANGGEAAGEKGALEGDSLDNWVEAVDPSSGQTYYYNMVSQETSWEKPAKPPQEDESANDPLMNIKIDSPKQDEPTSVQANDNAAALSIQNEVEFENKGSPNDVEGVAQAGTFEDESTHPGEWVETVNASNGQTYYYNTTTQETSWEKPVMSVNTETVVDEAGAVSAFIPATQTESKNKEFPSSDLGVEASTPETIQDTKAPLTMELSNEVADAEASETGEIADADPSADWVESVDPASGQIYYYNAVTQETSWEKPAAFIPSEAPVVSDVASAQVDKSASIEADDDTSSADGTDGDESEILDSSEREEGAETSEITTGDDDELPVGWVEAKDPSSGQIYYYNTATEETSWEKPAKYLLTETADDKPKIEEAKELGQGDLSSESAFLEDSREGERPIPSVVDETTPPAIEEDEATEDITHDSIVDGLSDDWVEAVDPTNGQTYYYNTTSQETSWEKPVAQPIEVESTGTPHEEDEASGHVATETEQPTSAKHNGEDSASGKLRDADHPETALLLPEGWTERVDPTSGKTYYYNEFSNETSWGRPHQTHIKDDDIVEDSPEIVSSKLVDAAISSEAATPPEEEKPQISDADELEVASAVSANKWAKKIDPQTGRTYYSNLLSEEISWEKPDGLSTSAEEPDKKKQADAIDAHASRLEEDVEVDGGIDLLSGWTEVVDSSSGNVFFYNTATGETSWEKPAIPCQVADQDAKQSAEPESSETEREGSHSNEFEKPKEDREIVDEEGAPDAIEDVVEEDVGIAVQDETPPEATPSLTLPEFWTEAVDESSARTYYFNTLTQETSWERPEDEPETTERAAFIEQPDSLTPEETQDDLMSEESSDASLPGEEASDNLAPTESEEVLESELMDGLQHGGRLFKLPPDWSEVEDPQSGQSYYVNSVTQETKWDRPGEEQPLSVTLDDSESKKSQVGSSRQDLSLDPLQENVRNVSDLPEGWSEVVDPNSKEVYYYNGDTGESSWDLPLGPDAGDSSADDRVAKEVMDEQVTEVSPHGDDVDGVQEIALNLPADWTEGVDPQTNETYYYNGATGETSWDIPTSELEVVEPSDQDEEASVVASVDGVDAQVVHAAARNTLAEGWERIEDESSGGFYFYNHSTGETTWDQPSESVDQAEPTYHDQTDNVGSSENSSPPENQDNLEPPETSSVVEDGQHDPDPDPDSLLEEPDALLEGWVELVDPGSGATYYFNELDNITTWEWPVASVTESEDAPTEKTEPEEDRPKSESEPSGSKPPSPSGSAADNMSVVVDEVAPKNGPGLVKNVDIKLSEGWVELADPSSGNPYFFNETTHETSWVRPAASHVETPTPVSDSDAVESNATPEEERPENENETTGPEENLPIETNHGTTPLADGWVEVMDPSSDQPYFFNESENRTAWERPVKMSMPKPQVEGKSCQPASATVALGFGGTLCSLLSEDKHVLITRTTKLTLEHSVAKIEQDRRECNISGPLNSSEESSVLAYIEKKVEDKAEGLLWRLIEIAARSKGRLRSLDGVHDKRSPEHAIVQLLLQDNGGQQDTGTRKKQQSSDFRADKEEIDEVSSMVKVQSLLLRGNRKEAVEEAIACHDFATAFLVASMCDSETYKRTATAYAERAFVTGSPMHTVALLLSGGLQAPPPSASKNGTDHWGVSPAELKMTWKEHLAAIISNRTVGWDSIVVSLGDRLMGVGELQAAHFCFMVCGCPPGPPTMEGTRISLVGCDHTEVVNMALMTDDSVGAYDRTEAYEWAKRRGNKNATIKSFQAFKVIYATVLMDSGLKHNALLLVESIRQCSDILLVENGKKSMVSTLSHLFEDPQSLAYALSDLECRLGCRSEPKYKYDEEPEERVHTNAKALPPQSIDMQVANSGERETARQSSSYQIPVAEFRVESKIESKTNGDRAMPEPGLDTHQGMKTASLFPGATQIDAPKLGQSEAGMDTTFVSAKSNLMDVTGYAYGTPEKPTSAIQPPELKAAEPPKMITQNGVAGFAAMPPKMITPRAAAAKQPPSLRTPQQATSVKEKPKSPPNTAPPVMVGNKKKEKTSQRQAPSSSDRKASWGLRQRLVRWINPDATEVALPEEEEKAYYDEKRKVWVFPGDNPDELVKPIGPPPTPGAMMPGPAPEPEAKPNDPLAAMMAPPKRGPSALKKPGMSGGLETPQGYPGMPSPGMFSPPAAGGAPPQFAVFTPKPVSEGEQKAE